MVAFATLYRNGSKVLDGQAVQVTLLPESRLGTIPLDLKLPLQSIEAGEYQCQVTVLDPAKDRAVFWQGSCHYSVNPVPS